MITGITIENFKGIGSPVRLDLKPITMLFGSNSAGKSTIFHAMLYAYEVLVNHNLDADETFLGGDSIDLGGFRSFVHGHDLDRQVTIALDIDLNSVSLLKEWPIGEHLLKFGRSGQESKLDLAGIGDDVWSAKVSFSIGWNRKANICEFRSYRVEIDGQYLGQIIDNPAIDPDPLLELNLYHPLFDVPDGTGATMPLLPQLVPEIRSWREQLFYDQGEPVKQSLDEAWYKNPDLVFVGGEDDLKGRVVRTAEQVSSDDRNYHLIMFRDEDGLKLWGFLFPAENGWDFDGDKETIKAICSDAQFEFRNAQTPQLRLEQPSVLPNWHQSLKPLFVNPTAGLEFERVNDPANQDVYENLLSRLLLVPGRILAQELKRSRYIGPLRKTPARNYQTPHSRTAHRWANGLGAWDLLSRHNDRFVEHVSNWIADPEKLSTGYSLLRKWFKLIEPKGLVHQVLSGRLGIDEIELARESFEEAADQIQFAFRDERSGVEIAPRDIAVGITQLLPVVVDALDRREYNNGKGMSMVEQPELHNHPSVEVGLGDLYIESIGRRGRQACRHILETHGEHMALRMLRRIRQGNEGELPEGHRGLQPDEIAIYHVSRTTEGTVIRPMPVDKTGEFIHDWPGGFFDERSEELFG